MSGLPHPDERIAYLDAQTAPRARPDCEPEFAPLPTAPDTHDVIRDLADYQPPGGQRP